MTKLIYPIDGIYSCCSKEIVNSSQHLNKAVESSNYYVPFDFDNKHYLDNLKDQLQRYSFELKSIELQIKKIDKSYSSLETDLLNSIDDNSNYKLKLRNRMIR